MACRVMLTLLVPKPHVGLVDFVDSFCAPVLLRGWAVPGPGLFMPKACFSCSLDMKAAGQEGQTQHAGTHTPTLCEYAQLHCDEHTVMPTSKD